MISSDNIFDKLHNAGINFIDVALLFVINYIVMILLGYNLIGGATYYAYTGEMTEALSLIQFELNHNKNSFIWAMTSPTIFAVLMCLLFYVFTIFVLILLIAIKENTEKLIVFWMLIASQWVVFIWYFFDTIFTYMKYSEKYIFIETLFYSFCYSMLPIFVSTCFWWIVRERYLKDRPEVA